MDRTPQQDLRLVILARYQAYVEALRQSRLDAESETVLHSRIALARAIEQACPGDPDLLADFKRAFALRPHA